MQNLVSKTATRARVINPKAALIVATVIAATCFGLTKLHDKQFAATLNFLRTKAFDELEKKDYRAAQRELTQFLAFNPSDLEAREKLSWVLSDQIETRPAMEQALRHNEDLLRKGFGDDSLRLRQARIAVQLGMFSDANAHLKSLQASLSDNSEVWYLSGCCAKAERDIATATNCFKRSIRCKTPAPEAFAELARLANDATAPEFSAESLLKQMVETSDSPKAWEMRAEYHFGRGDLVSAIEDLWQAIPPRFAESTQGSPSQQDEDNQPTVNLPRLNAMLANSLQKLDSDTTKSPDAQKQLRRAIDYFSSLISESPRDPNLRLYLTAVYQKLGQRNDAIKTLEDGIQQNPRAFALHTTLIDLLVDSGEPARASRLLESIPAGGLSRDASAYCRGRLLMAEKKWKEAIVCFEEAIGFGAKGSGLLSRAQLSLAMCRSRGTDATSAVETFRSVVAENPQSVSARLGMASAWIKAGQTDLAIAEYRGLVTVPGVAPYLADLLIQKTAAQPASLRDWNEVDELLREDHPKIADPIQRLLLRADRLFASGQIVSAINTLENAQVRLPDQIQIKLAAARVHTTYADGIRQRLETLVSENPLNSEAHAALIREQLAQTAKPDQTEATFNTDAILAAMSLVDAIAEGKAPSVKQLSTDARLLLAIDTLRIVITLERRLGRESYTAPLETALVRFSKSLAEKNSVYESQLVSSLVRSGRTSEALAFLTESKAPSAVNHRGDAIVEFVRSSFNRSTVLPAATNLMYDLIRRNPANTDLRIGYADLLLFSAQYDLAEQTLMPLANLPGSEAPVDNRRAWLRAAQLKDLDEALTMATTAVRSANGDLKSRETRARVFLARRQFEDALRELELAGFDHLSLAGQIYRITALLNLEREGEATVAFEQLHVSESDRLFPADKDLLVALSERIRMPATEDSQDTQKPTRTAVSGEKQL